MAKYKGTDGDDIYTLNEDAADTVRMRGGNDIVRLSAATWDVSEDRVDAGKGEFDLAILDGGGFYNFGHGRFAGFEQMALTGEGAFEIYIDDSVGVAGTTFTVFGAGSSSDEFQPASLFIDWSPERDSSLLAYGSNGDDAIIGGFRTDEFHGGTGRDLMTGNDGADRFMFEAVDGADRWGKDRITDFHVGRDKLVFVTDSVADFDDLRITDAELGAVIRTGDGGSSVTLYGVLARDLEAGDFVFGGSAAPVHHALAMHDGALLV